MAEFVMKKLVHDHNLDNEFLIESKATSREEIGNSPHPGTLRKMRENNIPVCRHQANQMVQKDYDRYDYIIGMDQWNYSNILKITKSDPENKIFLLKDFTSSPGDIADPWYTGNFDATYDDILNGCNAFLNFLLKKQ